MTTRDALLQAARRRADGDLDGTIAALDALAAERPDDAYVLHARGRARFDRAFLTGEGDIEADQREALELVEAAVERAPADPFLHTELAFMRQWGHADAAGAEASYRRALALEPDYEEALLGAADLHGNPSADVSAEEATSWRQRAARLRPEDSDNWLALASLHEAAGRADQAERARVRALLARHGVDPDAVAEQWHV